MLKRAPFYSLVAGIFALQIYASEEQVQHDQTKALLHSHEIPYGSGSGQQSVTADFQSNDANSMWFVRLEKDEPCEQGAPIKKGTAVRLQHMATRRWLHSHHFASPITNNQEISAFGDDDNSDASDLWIVQWDKGGNFWLKDQKVSLRHHTTKVYLASHNQKYGRPISGQQEVCGKAKPDTWVATEGIYFPQRA